MRGATRCTVPKIYLIFISIHAPLAGCDRIVARYLSQPEHFNPRTPCGVRQGGEGSNTSHTPFQSTHPLRGATFFRLLCLCLIVFQSTHPLRGATQFAEVQNQCFPNFNPRTPCGVRPSSGRGIRYFLQFQSTHPLRGATNDGHDRELLSTISIHAPLAGCDRHQAEGFDTFYNFNPRTPCGVRHLQGGTLSSGSLFQSTHPLRGATHWFSREVNSTTISIHAPLAGCDVGCLSLLVLRSIFQSTHPLRGATASPMRSPVANKISIHAPLAGCDNVFRLGLFDAEHFNPRTPCGVRRRDE